jgi:hypothetical protein
VLRPGMKDRMAAGAAAIGELDAAVNAEPLAPVTVTRVTATHADAEDRPVATHVGFSSVLVTGCVTPVPSEGADIIGGAC